MNLLLLLRQKLKPTPPRVPRITQAGFIKFTKKSLATYLIVFIAFSGTTGIFLFNPFGTKTADAAWFNDNWSYRQVATVTVTSSASDITDLQTILTIDTSTLITAGKLQSSCQDLRFTNQSGKILPYYIDSGCNTASTKVWVLADLVPKNTTTYLVYMYYGNPSAIAGSGTFPNFNLVQGLAGYWTGNESSWNGTSGEVKDSSVNGNNGTATGGLSTTTGKYGNSGDWDSTDDAISLGSPSAVDNLPANGMTFSAWIYPDSLGQSNVGFITAKNNGSSQNAGWIIHVLTSNSILFVVDGSTDLVVQTSTSAFTTSAWNHVVLSWAGDITSASSVDIYVNGVEATYVTQTNGASRVDDASSSLYIGNSSASNRTFDGKIDDYRLYNRAFSAAEVVQLYQNPGSITTTATTTSNPSTSFASEEKGPSPVAYWKLDEGQGTTAYDSTANGLNGTLVSGPTVFTEDRCVAGKCYWSDGVGDYFDMGTVDASNNTKLNISGAMTVSFWYRPNETASSVLVSRAKGTSAVDESFTIQLTSSNYLTFFINPTSGSTKTITSTKTPLQLGQWYHVTATYSPSTSMTLYVNGQVEETSTSSIPSDIETVTGAKLYFAGICSTNCTALSSVPEGAFDELKIYNFAQTAAQVAANYNARENSEGLASQSGNNNQNLTGALSQGLTGYWNMDATSGNAADSSGMVTTLTNNSSTSYTTGKFGSAGSFVAASTDYFSTATTISGVKTVSFWTYNASSTDEYINLTSGAYITSSSGTLSATGFTSPQIYVNGVLNGTLTTSTWNHVVVTTDTSIDANQFEVGRANSAYNNGRLDEIRLYTRALSPADIAQLYTWAPGPVGYWRMDDGSGTTIKDSSGNGLTSNAFSGNTSFNVGQYGKGLYFDGTDDSVTISEDPLIDLGKANQSYTVSLWVKGKSVGGNTVFASKGSGFPAPGAFTLSTNNFNTPFFIVSNSNWSTSASADGTTNIMDNKWHHIAGVRNEDTDLIYIYVDGRLEDTTVDTTAGTDISTDVAVYLGTRNDGGDDFNGFLDEFKLYNYARTASQIVQDMNAGHPAPGSPVATPIGHWKFDEGYATTANNSGSAGSLLPGTLTNMDSPATSTSGWANDGKFNKAISFNGSSSSGDYVNIPYHTSLNVTTDITLTAWIKKAADADYGGIISKTDGSTLWDYDFFICDSGCTAGNNYLGFYSNSTTPDEIFSNRTLTGTEWHHVAITRSGSTVTFYIDGLPAGGGAMSGAFASNSLDLKIGTDGTGSGVNQFNGKIDEPKIYNQALTADQIKLDFNRSSAQILGAMGNNSTAGSVQSASQEYCVPGDSSTCTAPVLRYDLEEGSGTTANDSSGSGNTGTITAGTGAYSTGKVGKGYTFDGADTVINAGSGTTLDDMSGISLEAWIYPRTTGEGSNAFIIDKNLSNTQNAGWIFHYTSNQGLLFVVDGSTDLVRQSSNSVVPLNRWSHIAMTWGGNMASASTVRMFVNGLETGYQTTTNGASRVSDAARSLYVGNASSSDRTFDGYIDQVRVFNYERTPAQVAWSYNKSAPVAYWKMDECQGTTLNNSISSSFAGTLTVGGSGSSTTVGTCTTSGAWFNGVSGKRNYSISLDGTDDYVTLANASSFPANNASQTMAAWLYYPTTPGSTATAISLVNTGSSSITAMQVRSGNIGVFKWGGTSLASTTQPAQATWNHVVYTFDGTTHSLYLNGRLANTSTTAANSATPNAAYFGDYTASGGEYWPGQIDDVRIYNYPLTAAQALLLYNDGAARYGPVTGAP